MKKQLVAVLLLVLGTSAWGQTPEMKPGLWDMKVSRQLVDGRDMTVQMAAAQQRMQDAMAKMTPEQRAQMQSMMKNLPMQAEGGSIHMCISPAMAAKHMMAVDREGHCAPATVTASGNKFTYSFSCDREGHSMSGTGQAIITGDTISSHADINTTDAKGKHTMVIDSQMTYLGADCQGIKPADQIMKELQAAHR